MEYDCDLFMNHDDGEIFEGIGEYRQTQREREGGRDVYVLWLKGLWV